MCPLHGAVGNGKAWGCLGGAAWQHLTSNPVTRKQFPLINGKELTDRLWEGPGLADATPRAIKD